MAYNLWFLHLFIRLFSNPMPTNVTLTFTYFSSRFPKLLLCDGI
jgi:hypothetical protein